MEITPLMSLKPFKYSYRICVRICRTWRAIRYGAEDYNGLHCVLVDQQGASIHAFLPEEQVEDMIERPRQGQMYEIHQFSTKEHTYGLKPVNNPVVIQFNGRTIFCKVDETVPPIAANCFHLIEFNQLNSKREAHAVPSSHAVLADIYGCIRSIRPPHPQFIKRQNKTGVKCEITLENLQRETLTVVFWGKLAREFDVDAVTSSPSPVLAVITGLKITQYDQQVIANNYDHTCLLLDPPTPWTEKYKTEFSKPGDKIKVLGDFHVFETTEPKNTLSVQCLTGLNPVVYKARSVLCKGKIIKIGTNGWWYRRCAEAHCYKQCFKAENLDDKYACKAHGLQAAIPCFRLSVLIGDDVSDVSITAMGNQAEQLIGCKLESLRKKRFYVNEQVIPPEIASLIGQIRVFELRGNPFGEWTVIGVGPSINVDDVASPINETMISVGLSTQDYNIASPIDETVIAVDQVKQYDDISSPLSETGTGSHPHLADPALYTPEKHCIQQKRTHEAIQHSLFSGIKKNKKETNDISASSSAIKRKDKFD